VEAHGLVFLAVGFVLVQGDGLVGGLAVPGAREGDDRSTDLTI
jgi:hypothetical protein